MTRTVFYNGTVMTCGPESARIENAEVTVEDGLIVAVGPGESERGLSDVEYVDLRGRYLLPGLWDAHIHLGSLVPPHEGHSSHLDPRNHMARCIAKAQDNLRCGVTSVRSLGERDGADIQLRDLINSGLIEGPTIYASGDPHWSLTECGVDNYRRHVRELAFSGVDQIKLLITGGIPYQGAMTSLTTTRDELEAAVAEARAWSKPVAVHAMGDTAVRLAADCGVDTIEHAFACTSASAEALAASDVIYCPNLAVTQYWNPKYAASQGLPQWMGDNTALARSGHHEMFATAVGLGVPVCAGVDNLPKARGDFGIEHVGDVPGIVLELELMEANGLSRLGALKAATLVAARATGVGDSLGSIEVGKVADLVAFDRDPTASLRNLTSVSRIWKAGRPTGLLPRGQAPDGHDGEEMTR